ncbi:MAG: plastocyanin/azurin family copper-binding protein [Halobacteriales archaeon]|nr:plastocyanin/azurin family copper-binding protein [Halobacteriales archaeon]
MAGNAISRRRALRTLGGALSLTLAGCSGSASTSRTVEMTDDLQFKPASVTVKQGTTVTWENVGSVGHTVTAYADGIPDGATYFASGGFESERTARQRVTAGLIAAGETFEHTFERSGTYEYFCIPHESSGMTGSVQVK